MDNKRFTGIAFWDGLGLGVFIGVICSIILFCLLGSGIQFLEDNAVGFFATLATLLAATLALIAIRTQINHANTLDKDRNKNMLIAAKSDLPNAISSLMKLSVTQIKYNAKFMDPNPFDSAKFEYYHPSFPTIKECIPFADPISQKWLALIIKEYQVLVARSDDELTGVIAHPPAQQTLDGYNLISSTLDWAEFYAILEHILDYSRSKTSIVSNSFNSGRIGAALTLSEVFVDDIPSFVEQLEGRRKRYANVNVDHWT